MTKKDSSHIKLSLSSGDSVKTDVTEFAKFHELLIKSAPEGYVPHYMMCGNEGKTPVTKHPWEEDPLTYEEARSWLEKGNNVAIGGTLTDPLVIIDIDNAAKIDYRKEKPTLTVCSAKRKGFHIFYFSNEIGFDPLTNRNSSVRGVGEVRHKNEYVMAAGSYALKPEYDLTLACIGRYTVEVERPPSNAVYDDLPEPFKREFEEFAARQAAALERKAEQTFINNNRRAEDATNAFDNLKIEDLGFTQKPHARFASPFHPSATQADTSVSNGTITCWAHHRVFGPQQYLCAKSGFLSSEDAGAPFGGISQYAANGAAHYAAWKYAKKNGHIPLDDHIPRRLMVYLAISQDFCKKDEINDENYLPSTAYNDVLDYITSDGEDPGLDKVKIPEINVLFKAGGSEQDVKVTDTIPLTYKEKNFGTLEIEPAYKGVNVAIIHEGAILIPKSKKKNDFYLQERTRDALFIHVKDALEVSEYNEFLSQLIPQIREVSELQRHKALETKKDEEIIIHTSKIEHQGMLYEEVYEEGTVAFVDGAGTFYEILDIDGVKYKPIYGDELKEGAVLLPSGIEEYCDEKTLIEEIKAHIHKYVDVSQFFETISAYYVLLTWLYDEVNTLPYLRALGDTGCGKSRYEDVVGRICYKATIVSGAITPAPIYRLIRKWGGTIIIDEGDFKASDEQNEVVKILNCGFERGRPVVRSQKDNPDNLQFLPTFSPKILSSRKRFKDVALESRCLTEVMRETDREDIPYLLPPEFYEVEASLKNKLLKFRFKNHGSIDLLKAQKLKNVKVEDRLKQAVSSFIVLFANNEEIYDEFIKFLEAYNSELVEERSSTYEGGIVHAIFLLMRKNKGSLPPSTVTNVTNVTGGKTLNTVDISDELANNDLSEVEITATDIKNVMTEELDFKAEYTTARSIGKRLKVLGFTSKRMKAKDKTTKALLILEARHLNKLFKKYIPVSVMKNIGSYDSYVCYGNGGVNGVKKLMIQEHGECELCSETRQLTYEWIDGGIRCLVCSECAKDKIELIEKQEREVAE